MRNTFNILVAATLMSGAAMAQNNLESFDDIVKEISPAQELSVASDVDAMIEASRAQFLSGKFAQAQQGFAAIVKLDPENQTAAMYMRALLERDEVALKTAAMDSVDSAWLTDIVVRSYSLADGASEKMELADTEKATDVSGLFPQVDFPKGTSAIYQPDMGVLFVRNTRANFDVLEAILDAMDVLKDAEPSDQVEIEAKFVEVSEGTLEELGFQWNLNGLLSGGDYAMEDGPGLLRNSLRGSTIAADNSLPFAETATGYGQTAASGDWSTFRVVDAFNTEAADVALNSGGATPLELIISALDQSSGADVLSAPRITTKSGEEATIRVGELHYFPEVYEADASDATPPHVSYQDFEEKLLGVELAVTPEVEDNMITMALNPSITEIIGWQNYEIAPTGFSYTHRQGDIEGSYEMIDASGVQSAVVAKLPIFKVRQIETEVTIANGSTIGMGGLISATSETYEDKVPLLGDIPFVGRLFRNEGERVIKRNLLMFVTANIVEPSGHIKNTRSFE